MYQCHYLNSVNTVYTALILKKKLLLLISICIHWTKKMKLPANAQDNLSITDRNSVK